MERRVVYFTLPQAAAPTTNQILARHVKGSPTYNMLYKNISIFIYTDKTKYAVASFKRRSSSSKSKMTSRKTSAQPIMGKTARHVLQNQNQATIKNPTLKSVRQLFPNRGCCRNLPVLSPYRDGRVGNNSLHGTAIPILPSAVKVSQDPLLGSSDVLL